MKITVEFDSIGEMQKFTEQMQCPVTADLPQKKTAVKKAEAAPEAAPEKAEAAPKAAPEKTEEKPALEKTEEKPAPEKTEEKPAETAQTDAQVTDVELRELFGSLIKNNKKTKVKELFGKLGIKSLKELPSEKYAEALQLGKELADA